ncbi:MAG: rhomboid family intramembrane serine protease [Crocinitomicaceae bacterium]
MQEQNIFEYIKAAYRRSGAIGQLIAVNVVVSIFFGILFAIQELFLVENLSDAVKIWFAAPGDPAELMYKPWSLITQLFTHGGFAHLAFNMIFLYFTGQIFVQFFGERRLITTYILGGIFAYLFHIGCYYIFPAFQEATPPGLVGASGSIYGIFAAIAIHRPKFTVYFFGVIRLPLILLLGVYIFLQISSIGNTDGIAHLAHIGGAIFGAISVINVHSPANFMNRFDRWWGRRFKLPKVSFKSQPKMKVYKGNVKEMTDEEFNAAKKIHQERVDAILEKISKKGYESLTKKEKEILFNESKRK